MGSSTGSQSSSKAGLQKKQGQAEANQIIEDLGKDTKGGQQYETKGQFVYKLDKDGNRIGQVAGPGYTGGSGAVDVIRKAGYQTDLDEGGLGEPGSILETMQLAKITGKTPEEIVKERKNITEVYGRDPVRRLGIDRFGDPMAYGAAAPTTGEFLGDLNRGIFGGTYGSRMRGEPAPEGYEGLAKPLATLAVPGGMVRNMFSNIYNEGKEFVTTPPIDYFKNLGIFTPTETEEMDPRRKAYLENFRRRQDTPKDTPIEQTVATAPVEEIVQEEIPSILGGYDASIQPEILYPYGTGSALVSYEDLINRIG